VQFIAEHPVTIGVTPEAPAIYDAKGRMIHPATRFVSAQFTRGIAPEWAYQEAAKRFSFTTMPQGVSRRQWVSFYDSLTAQDQLGWTDDEREAIERVLSNHPHCVKVERPRIQPPYPSYDKQRRVAGRRTIEHAIAEIVETVKSTGIDPELVISYEIENENDPQVIAAMEALKAEEPEPEPLIAA
jgi:hypothetical protein